LVWQLFRQLFPKFGQIFFQSSVACTVKIF
jgi:hypothetical protein